MARIHVAGT